MSPLPLAHHVAACRTARLPGGRQPLSIGGEPVGWVQPAVAERLPALDMTAGVLAQAARTLAGQGAFHWRGEAFDVRARTGGPVLAQIDRGALPVFGIRAEGVHVNGLVHRPDGPHLWIARRAADKPLDPGKLDHIVAGGVPAGLTPAETLVKEAAEEAAIPPALVAQATPVGRLAYAMERPEGLRRDVLHLYDLLLPDGFTPRPADGEVEAFELWPVARVLETVRAGDAFKFNVNLVLIDLFLRLGLVGPPEREALRAGLDAPE